MKGWRPGVRQKIKNARKTTKLMTKMAKAKTDQGRLRIYLDAAKDDIRADLKIISQLQTLGEMREKVLEYRELIDEKLDADSLESQEVMRKCNL